MADYIYLLQTRLTPAQQTALAHVREIARQKAITVFLVGGTVRDLAAGHQIRDIDVAVQGNALKLKKDLQKAGFTVIGEADASQTLWLAYPGGVRIEVGATLTQTFPKPGKPVYKPAAILDDLRRRDFTANSMAISLNDGSYGLLMDPLNGMADIENRELRLVSNYGFIEDPVRMIRAQRLAARLGWSLEEKTEQRYQTGKTEGYISAMSPAQKGYELEEIFHEEDPLRVMRRLESEGWMKVLFPAWGAAKANENELNKVRDLTGALEGMNIFPDPSAAYFGPLTAKLAPKDIAALKKSFARPGFAEQVAALEPNAKAFTAKFTSKEFAAPSAAWKLLYASEPEAILWMGHTSKSTPVQNKLKGFLTEWGQARTKIPYQTMQEMRITPDLPVYNELLEKLFFAIMDAQLETPEATKAFLEPYSPPAPPPPVTLRRRAMKREAKPTKRSKKAAAAAEAAPAEVAAAPAVEAPAAAPAPEAPAKPAKAAVTKAEKPAPVPAPKKAEAKAAKPAPAKATPAKKAAPAKAAKPAPKPVAKKVVAKAPAKKVAAKVVKKAAPAKKAPAKKPAPKPVKKAAPAKPVKKAPVKKAAPAKKAKKR